VQEGSNRNQAYRQELVKSTALELQILQHDIAGPDRHGELNRRQRPEMRQTGDIGALIR
jgi:hypothetical protein